MVATAPLTTDWEPVLEAKLPPWEHQREAYNFCWDKPGAALLMAMGVGKSAVVSWLITNRRHQRTLILAPKSVARSVWANQLDIHAARPLKVLELASTSGTAKTKIFSAERHLKEATRHHRQAVVIINYDLARQPAFATWALKQGWDFLVLDECHKLKSPSGVTSRFVGRLARTVPWRIGLTGTPMPKNFLDIWPQYRAIAPDVFGGSFTAFKAKYGIATGYLGYDTKLNPHMALELNRKLYSVAFRVDDSVLDLPPVQDIDVPVTLGPEARRAYDKLKADMIVRLGEGKITPANALVELLKLQQIAQGQVTLDDGTRVEIDTAKEDALFDILEGLPHDEPVVVFGRFHSDLDAVQRVAGRLGRGCAELSGRRNEFAEWQAAEVPILAAQLQAGGLGIDATRAKRAIFYAFTFSGGDWAQAKARIHRPGQQGTAFYHYLVAEHTVDRKILAALRAKVDAAEFVLRTLGEE